MNKYSTLKLKEIILELFIGYSHKNIDSTPIQFFLDTNVPEGCNYTIIKDQYNRTAPICKLMKNTNTIIKSQDKLQQHFTCCRVTDDCFIYLNNRQENILQQLLSLIK